MRRHLRAAWQAWKRIAEKIMHFQQLLLWTFLYFVVVGPFASREEAVVAQAQIARLHLTNSRIVSTAPTEGAIVHPLRPVATTGSKGQP